MFRTLDDLKDKKKEEKEKREKDSKKNTDSYAGGGKSGLAVENPHLDEIVRKAEEGGKSANHDSKDINCKITLYKNGFVVDDGPFRAYEAPENKEFMAELNNGNVPRELRTKYPKGLQVGLEDKRKENFELPPPPKYIAFSGQGVSLSGGSPGFTQAVAGKVNMDASPPKVDDSKPKTTIQIKLHTGQKTQVTLNLDEKVIVLFDYVMRMAPVNGPFSLLSGFPAKALANPNLSIQEAELEDSVVTQRLD